MDTYECCDRLPVQFYETWKVQINSADLTEKFCMTQSTANKQNKLATHRMRLSFGTGQTQI